MDSEQMKKKTSQGVVAAAGEAEEETRGTEA